MPGPPPKPTRQRRNKPATAAPPTAASSVARKRGKVPALPNRGRGRAWHPDTRKWWAHVWESPHAWRYSAVEMDGLLDLAGMVDTVNKLPPGDDRRLKWHAEIRMQRRDYGLTPADRLRLGWSEDDRPEGGPRAMPVVASDADEDDPRAVLRAVK